MSNWGIAPHDYSAIAVRGIVGRFFKMAEQKISDTFSFKIGVPIPSNQPFETYKWLGHPSQMRRWLGGRLIRGLPVRSYRIDNLIFEDTLGVDVEDWRYDKTGQLAIRFAELAGKGATHWDRLTNDMLVANPLAWDGLAMFSANHAMGGSNTAVQSNDLSAAEIPGANIVSLLAMTSDEAIDIIFQVFPKFYEFLDNANEPYNNGMKSMRILCAPRHAGAFKSGLMKLLVTAGGSNPLGPVLNAGTLREAWDIDVLQNPYAVGAPNTVYFFRTDSPMKAVILQAVFKGAADSAPDGSFDLSSDLEMSFLGEGSETAFHRNQYLFGLKAARNTGVGEWAHAIRLTLS